MRAPKGLCAVIGIAIAVYAITSSARVQAGVGEWSVPDGITNHPGLALLEEYKVAGIEPELSGIYPHPSDDALYLVVANKHPAYRAGQRPTLPPEYRGKLLTVNRHTGQVVRATPLVDGEYGDLAFGDGYLFVSSLNPPEILKVNILNDEIVGRFPLSGPAGGLEYDQDRAFLVAQLYVGWPHLAVIDPVSGVTIETLWSDESAMGLAKVNGDWLCTWVSGFDEKAFGELRRLDQKTGKVRGRIRLDAVHSSLAPLNKKIAGTDGFISLVTTDKDSGRVAIRKYGYAREKIAW